MGYPAPPDPKTVLANTIGTQRPNVVGPGGTATYVPGVDGAPGTYTQTLAPGAQGQYDATVAARTGAANAAGAAAGMIPKGPLDFSGAPSAVTSVNTPSMGRADAGMLPSFGQVSGAGQGILPKLDYSGLGAMPEASDATRQRVEDSMYSRQTARLDPQFQQEMQRMSSQLANMGIPIGSEPYKVKMEQYAAEKEKAYSGARNDAITMGGAEQSRLLADALRLRQQGKSETDTAGAFQNASQQQGFTQGMSQTGANNAVNQQSFTNAMSVLGQQNTAAQQEFQNAMSNANMTNTERQRAIQEMVTKYQLPSQVASTMMAAAGGLPQAPSMAGIPAIDVPGISNSGYQNQLSQANAQAALKNQLPAAAGKLLTSFIQTPAGSGTVSALLAAGGAGAKAAWNWLTQQGAVGPSDTMPDLSGGVPDLSSPDYFSNDMP